MRPYNTSLIDPCLLISGKMGMREADRRDEWHTDEDEDKWWGWRNLTVTPMSSQWSKKKQLMSWIYQICHSYPNQSPDDSWYKIQDLCPKWLARESPWLCYKRHHDSAIRITMTLQEESPWQWQVHHHDSGTRITMTLARESPWLWQESHHGPSEPCIKFRNGSGQCYTTIITHILYR